MTAGLFLHYHEQLDNIWHLSIKNYTQKQNINIKGKNILKFNSFFSRKKNI